MELIPISPWFLYRSAYVPTTGCFEFDIQPDPGLVVTADHLESPVQLLVLLYVIAVLGLEESLTPVSATLGAIPCWAGLGEARASWVTRCRGLWQGFPLSSMSPPPSNSTAPT